MKNLLFGLIATVLFSFTGNSQVSVNLSKELSSIIKTQININ